MPQENNNYAEGMLKGRMAESLVEELLRDSGNKVYRFGYEAVLQNLTQAREEFDRDTEAGRRICAIPDFVVIDNNGQAEFVEVKFRWDGKMLPEGHERLQRIAECWNAKLVLVNCSKKPFFQVANPPYLNDAGNLICHSILDESAWGIDEKMLTEREDLALKYFKSMLHPETRQKLHSHLRRASDLVKITK